MAIRQVPRGIADCAGDLCVAFVAEFVRIFLEQFKQPIDCVARSGFTGKRDDPGIDNLHAIATFEEFAGPRTRRDVPRTARPRTTTVCPTAAGVHAVSSPRTTGNSRPPLATRAFTSPCPSELT